MSEKTYRIGEAADALQLKSYVLRFWEEEFVQLKPLRTDKRQRLYTEAHIALLRRIKHLLHEQGMTIEGARRILADNTHGNFVDKIPVPSNDTSPDNFSMGILHELRNELLFLRQLLCHQHTSLEYRARAL